MSEKNWSYGFEKRFFAIKMDEYRSEALESPPHNHNIGGRAKLPAYYYTIEICPGSTSSESYYKVFRRYSEFEWLYYKLKPDSAKPLITLPPKSKSCFCQSQTDEFRFARQQELLEFLDDTLNDKGAK